MRTFGDLFTLVSRREGRGNHKTTGATTTTWEGSFESRCVELRITVRTRLEGEQFLTTASHRIRGSHVGSGGYFLDVELLAGDLDAAARKALARLIEAADEAERPARVRARGERLRSGVLGADILEGRKESDHG